MKFAFQAADGSVTILAAAPKEQLERAVGTPRVVAGVLRRVMTDDEYRAFVIGQNIQKGVIPSGANLVDLPDDWMPPDGNRAYREAWKLNGKAVEVDMPKARQIHMDKYIRPRRNAKLEETDALVAALDGGPVPADLKAQRQALRELPQKLDLSKAETVDQLKAMWPEELKLTSASVDSASNQQDEADSKSPNGPGGNSDLHGVIIP